MRALVCDALAPDLSGVSTRDWPEPGEPGPGEALIQVRAAGVNFPDLLMTQGLYQFRPEPPFALGLEGAGEVLALGAGAHGFSVGDAVVFGARLGAIAERIIAPIEALTAKPVALDWSAAAGFGAAYLTARVALVDRGALAAGETLLVLGATGGVGLAAVDLGRALGARVLAAASTPEKRAFLEGYGVETVLPASGFRDAALAATGGAGVDVAFDPVGGDAFDEIVRVMAFGGRLLAIGFASGRIPDLPVNRALIKGFSLVGVRAGEFSRRFPERGRAAREAIWTFAASGRARPHVGLEVPLAQGVEALAALAARRVIGKAVIRTD